MQAVISQFHRPPDTDTLTAMDRRIPKAVPRAQHCGTMLPVVRDAEIACDF
jgi:hypothetical protein